MAILTSFGSMSGLDGCSVPDGCELRARGNLIRSESITRETALDEQIKATRDILGVREEP